MKVAVPKVVLPEGRPVVFQPDSTEADSMIAKFKAG
jgi:hypothetical protein